MSEMKPVGPSPGLPQRILIVDDDPEILRLVAYKLDNAGYDVLTASSGQQALDVIVRKGLPHLAIVDIMMPNMTGFEFCQKVQQFCDMPVILLSVIDEEDTKIKGLEHFAEDYITKPFSPRELVARVQRILRRVGDFAYTLSPITSSIFADLTIEFAAWRILG